MKLHTIKSGQVPSTLHSGVINAKDFNLNKEIFQYEFTIRKEGDDSNYLCFIHDIFFHPDFKNIIHSIIHKLFRELSSVIGHNYPQMA